MGWAYPRVTIDVFVGWAYTRGGLIRRGAYTWVFTVYLFKNYAYQKILLIGRSIKRIFGGRGRLKIVKKSLQT